MRTPDETRLAAIKAEIHRLLPRNTPDSAAIFRCAQLFCQVEDEGLHEVDREPNGDSWGEKRFKVGPAQRARYLCIGRNLTKEETEGKTQGVDAMNQIAKAPPALRPEMWRLSEEERLSSGALSAGRQAAAGLAQQGRLEEAHKRLERAARARAEKEEQEAAARKQAQKLSGGARIVCALLAQVVLLMNLLGRRGALSQQELTEIRGAISRLNELDPFLASQQVPPEAPQPQSPSQSQSQSQSPPQSQSQSQPTPQPQPQPQPPEPDPAPPAMKSEPSSSEDPLDQEVSQVSALLKGLRPRQLGMASQALYDLAAGDSPEFPATRVRRLLKRNVPGLRDPDPNVRGLLALRLLISLPNCEMRLRALACMRKVPPAVQAAAQALLGPEVPAGSDSAPEPP